MAQWTRDITSNYPQIYKEFDGKVEVDGKKRKYWIQDLTEEYFEATLDGFRNGFTIDEPISRFAGANKDAACLDEMVELWREILKQNISIICLTKEDDGETKIAGFNCLAVAHKDEKHIEVKHPIFKRIFNVIGYTVKQKNAFKEFGIDTYLNAMGLYVFPGFRGEGLGQIIINARELIAKELGFKMSLTVFTSVISQKQAERAGFKDLYVGVYEDMAKLSKDLEIPDIHTHSKYCKYMYIHY